MAIPAGLEPATLCLEGRCSIQLSYGTGLEIWPFITVRSRTNRPKREQTAKSAKGVPNMSGSGSGARPCCILRRLGSAELRSPRRENASTTNEGWDHKQMTRSNRCRATWPPDPTGGDYFRCLVLALRRRQLEARVRCFNVCLKRVAVITPRKRELPRPARSWDVCLARMALS